MLTITNECLFAPLAHTDATPEEIAALWEALSPERCRDLTLRACAERFDSLAKWGDHRLLADDAKSPPRYD